MSDDYMPAPGDQFTFVLWTVGNPGRDPFGHEVGPPLEPVDAVHRLGGPSPEAVAGLREEAAATDEAVLGAQGYGHERLDQLVTELLLGAR